MRCDKKYVVCTEKHDITVPTQADLLTLFLDWHRRWAVPPGRDIEQPEQPVLR